MAKSSGAKKESHHKTSAFKGNKKKLYSPVPSPSVKFQWGPLMLLALVTVIVLQTRMRLLAIPMERDEGGFAYIGHWLLHGKSLYTDIVDNKLPGLYFIYGIFTTLFGYNSTGVHLGLLLANAASAVCFFYLLKDSYNRFVATAGTSFFLVLMISPGVLGFAAHATHLLLPFALGGFLVFWKGIRSGRKFIFLIAGLLLGIAFIIKQQSIVFGILAACLWWPLRLVWNKKEGEGLPFLEWLCLGIGGLIPVVGVVVYFKITGRLDELYFWTVRQTSEMTGAYTNTSDKMFRDFIPIVTRHVESIWIMAGVGLLLVFVSGFKKGLAWFGLMLTILGLGSVEIGAAFYQHSFILALPGIALLAAVSLNWISLKTGKVGMMLGTIGAALMLLQPFINDREYFFSPDYNKIHQQAYNKNMFPELERIGQELSKRVPEGGRIGIMGSEPEVLVAADRESCSRHLFMYPLLSDPVLSPPMQNQYVQEMEECSPDYIVWNTDPGSWGAGYDKVQMFIQVFQWVQQNYNPVGMAEFRENKPGEIAWDDAIKTFQSQNDAKIFVFKRK